MICPKCGAQCPDGVKFCPQCGADISAQAMPTGAPDLSSPVSSSVPQPVNSSIPQPVNSSVPQPSAFGAQDQSGFSSTQTGMSAAQPTFGGQPGLSAGQTGLSAGQTGLSAGQTGLSAGQTGLSAGQPVQSPFGGQPSEPSYIPPQTYAPVTPVKRSSKTPIIIGACVAVVAVFLILLFTVIIPNIGGGGIEHRWTASEGGHTIAYDLKDNALEADGASVPIEWKTEGDKLTVTVKVMGITVSEDTYTYKLHGKTLTLTDEDGDSIDLTRAD